MKIKEQTKQLIILVAVFAVVLGIYYALRSENEKKAAQEQGKENFVALEQNLVSLNDLTELTFTDENGTILTFTKKDEIWKSVNVPDLSISQTAMEDIEYYFSGLKYLRAIKEPDDLSGYGLDPAVCTVCAVDVKGKTCTIQLGNEVDYEDIYYALGDSTNVVYTVEGGLMNSVRKSLLELAQVESLPEMTKATVRSISVMTEDTTVTVNKTTEKKLVTQTQETGEQDENGQPVTEEVEVVVEVYTWKLSNGKKVSGENEALLAVLDELSNLSFTAVCDFRPTEEEAASYGLKPVLTVDMMDATQLELWIGGTDNESATTYYARVKDSELIHTIDASSVDALLSLTAAALTA